MKISLGILNTANWKKTAFLLYVMLVACNKGVQKISPNCKLVKGNDGFMLITDWEFIHDTIFGVEQVGKSNKWIYAYGSHKSKNEKCWVHIADGVVVKIYDRCGQDQQSFYGRSKTTFYKPEQALQTLAYEN